MRVIPLIVAFMTAACSPVPHKSFCEKPNLMPAASHSIIEASSTWGIFTDYCPTEIPISLTVHPTRDLAVSYRLRGEWVDLRAEANGVAVDLIGTGIRKLEFDGFTHSVRHETISDQVIRVAASGFDEIAVPFEYIQCTCISYDAI